MEANKPLWKKKPKLKPEQLQWIKGKMEELSVEADKLTRELNDHPLKTSVKAGATMTQMHNYQIIPDSFEDTLDKEQNILLWRRIHNIFERAQSQLLENEKDLSNRAIKALQVEDLIIDLDPILDSVQTYFKYKALYKKKIKYNAVLLTIFLIINSIFPILFFVVDPRYGLVTDQISPEGARLLENICIVLILLVTAIMSRGLWATGLIKLHTAIKETRKVARMDNKYFWQIVEKEFGGIPTHDDLRNRWVESENILKEVFPPMPETEITG